MSLPVKLSLKGVFEAIVDEIKHSFFPLHLFDSDDESPGKFKNRIKDIINPPTETNEGARPSSSVGNAEGSSNLEILVL
jgi:hypothetical protein